MKIKISNRHGVSLEFLGEYELLKEAQCWNFNELTSQNKYILYDDSLSGFFTLPENSNTWLEGIDQDGADFFTNRYANRILTFRFRQSLGVDTIRQNQVFYQNNYLLNVEVKIEDRFFYTKGTLIGRVEDGVVELECSPFFTTGNTRFEHFDLNFHSSGTPYIPFRLPKLFFSTYNNNTNKLIVTPIMFPTTPKSIMISPVDDNISLDNLKVISGGSALIIEGSYKQIQVLCTEYKVIANGDTDITDKVTGIYPTLFPDGSVENGATLEFSATSQIPHTNVWIEWEEQSGGVF